ncbi:MAG: acylglycerol kinase family protein, partial [Candidatus Aminicenantes bacterium]|nr:acylglycerol kinase family protein [Candidatus Aminicenantes bacterium]
MKLLLIYNTHAGHKRAKKMLPEVESLFNEKDVKFDLYLTDYPEHARDIARNTQFDLYDG